MKLSEWVAKNGGPVAVGKLLGTTPHAVRYWLNGTNTPRVKTMLRIVDLSKGKVTIREIVQETLVRKEARSC